MSIYQPSMVPRQRVLLRLHTKFCRRLANVACIATIGLAFLGGLAGVEAAPRYADLVLDAHTGNILHATNADSIVHPASLTKIMTLYMVFDAIESGQLTLDQPIPISAHAASMPPSKLGLSVGSTIRVEDAIMSLITKSANDIAVALAEAVAGSEAEFGRRATSLAQQSLDMPSTVFVNASGLPASRQVTTARDMVNLAIRMRAHFPQYYGLFATRSFTYQGVSYQNHNKLLGSYAGTDGIKTGYINASGFNLVASAERNGRRIYGVIFGGSTGEARNNRMIELLDYGFAHLPSLPPRPSFVPEARGGGTAIADLIVETTSSGTVPDGSAPQSDSPPEIARGGEPIVRFAQLLTYGGVDGPRGIASGVQSAAEPSALNEASPASVPLPVILAALDPSKSDPIGPTALDQTCQSGWGIQIGAFARPDIARTVAAGARSQGTNALQNATIVIADMTSGDELLHRALLSGLANRQTADDACLALTIQGIECFAVSPSEFSVAGICS